MLTHETEVLSVMQNKAGVGGGVTAGAASTPASKAPHVAEEKSVLSTSSKSSRSDFDPSSFHHEMLDGLKDDARLVDIEVEEKRYAIESRKEEAEARRLLEIRKLESDERIAMQKMEADKVIAVAQAAAQEKQAEA